MWFHVDNLSSAHIYVRLPEGENWENISPDLLTDCAQLTKANSIEGKSGHDQAENSQKASFSFLNSPSSMSNKAAGNKKDNITIVYTPWSNLKKDGSMAVGQVGFKDQKKVRIDVTA